MFQSIIFCIVMISRRTGYDLHLIGVKLRIQFGFILRYLKSAKLYKPSYTMSLSQTFGLAFILHARCVLASFLQSFCIVSCGLFLGAGTSTSG
jgi:hypothetical protein